MHIRKRLLSMAILALVPAYEAAASWEVGGGAGIFIPWEGSSGLTVAGQLAFVDDDRPAWRVGAEFLYRDFDTTVFGVSGVSTQTYSLGAFAHYRIVRDFPVVPYVGADARASVNVIDSFRVASKTAGLVAISDVGGGIGFDGIFGLEVPLADRLIVFAEGRVGYDLQLTDTNGSLDTENFGGMTGLGGIRLVFGAGSATE